MFLLPQGADLPSEALALDHLLGGELAEVRAAEFKGKLGEVAVVRGAGRLREDAVALLGLGAADQLDGVRLRAAIQIGLRALAARGVLTPSLRWTGEPAPGLGQTAVGAAALEASVLARWSEATRRTGQPPKLHAALHLEGFDGLDAATAAEAAVLGEATNLARELVNAPANELTPAELARCAAEVAGESGLECEVLGDRELRKLGYGAILAVAAASQFPAQMVVLRHRAGGAGKAAGKGSRKERTGDDAGRTAAAAPVVALVGKGITFDTGGVSIKPAEGMERMRGDMGGAAAVLGAMCAIGRMKLPVEAIGILCIAENQLGGRAMRPGDVIRTGLGKTIEVVNTDAEGRLVLADGLHHAATLGATHIVDIATLTGAQRVALGPVAAAYVADDEMAARLEPAAAAAGERVWRMPAFPEYETMVESPVADLANSTGRDAGIIGAALLIRAFAHGLPWAHLDIAAPANSFNSRLSQLPKGPTGFGVRTLYRLCQAMAAADAGAPAAATRRKSDSISRK